MAGTANVTPADNVLTFSVSAGWTSLGPGFYTTTRSHSIYRQHRHQCHGDARNTKRHSNFAGEGRAEYAESDCLSRRRGCAHHVAYRAFEFGAAPALYSFRRQRHDAGRSQRLANVGFIEWYCLQLGHYS